MDTTIHPSCMFPMANTSSKSTASVHCIPHDRIGRISCWCQGIQKRTRWHVWNTCFGIGRTTTTNQHHKDNNIHHHNNHCTTTSIVCFIRCDAWSFGSLFHYLFITIPTHELSIRVVRSTERNIWHNTKRTLGTTQRTDEWCLVVDQITCSRYGKCASLVAHS